MSKTITKAARILALHAKGKTIHEIAMAVYGEASDKRMAYVRVVTRQRRGSQSEIDKRYETSVGGRQARSANFKYRWAHDEAFREYRNAACRRWDRKNPEKAARARKNRYLARKRARELADEAHS